MRSLKGLVLELRRELEKKDRDLRDYEQKEKALEREAEKLRQTNNRLRLALKERVGSHHQPGFESKEVKRLKEQLLEKNAMIQEMETLSKRKDVRIDDLQLSNELLHEANLQVEDCIEEEWTKIIEQKKALRLAPLVPDTPEPSQSHPAFRSTINLEMTPQHGDGDGHGRESYDSPLGVDEAMNDDSLFVIDCLAQKVATSEKGISHLQAKVRKAEQTRDSVCMTVLDALNREKAKVATLQALVIDRHTNIYEQ